MVPGSAAREKTFCPNRKIGSVGGRTHPPSLELYPLRMAPTALFFLGVALNEA